MAEVVKSEVHLPCIKLGLCPSFVEHIGTARAIFARFTKEQEAVFAKAHWVVYGILKNLRSRYREGNCSRRRILRVIKPDNATLRVHLAQS